MPALAVAIVVAAACVAVSPDALAGRRPPPSHGVYCATSFQGMFSGSRPAERSSFIELCPSDSATLVYVNGMVPATCREKDGRVVGPDRGISAQIHMEPIRVPIRTDGSFAFTARSGARVVGDVPRMPVRVRGVFDRTTVSGRVTFVTGPWWRYTRCTADARFRASIKGG